MTEIRKFRNGNAKFDLSISESVTEIYADGVSIALVGAPMAKVLFHSISPVPTEQQVKDGVEARNAILQLTMPVTSLIELAKIVLSSTEQNKDTLLNLAGNYRSAVENSLQSSGTFTVENIIKKQSHD